MNDGELTVPRLRKGDIDKRAQQFLAECAPDDSIPVDIEHIVEYELDLSIVPVESLKRAFNIDGWLSNDLEEITVDLNQYNHHINRCRFTIAHEVGHYILHRSVYEQLDFSSVESWTKTISNFDPDKFAWLEWHADHFASCLLMPEDQVRLIFDEAVEVIKGRGFSALLDSELVRGYIRRWMADKFEVSEQAMGYRLKNIGLFD